MSTSVIMDGPIDRIVLKTRQAMWQLGRDGGYFCRPDQRMPFPPAHLKAHEQAVDEHGWYPLADVSGMH